MKIKQSAFAREIDLSSRKPCLLSTFFNRSSKKRNNRGADKNELKDYTGAIADFTKVIELDPDYARAWYNRGVVRMNLQEYKKAISDFNKAIELQPGYKEAQSNKEIAERKKEER